MNATDYKVSLLTERLRELEQKVEELEDYKVYVLTEKMRELEQKVEKLENCKVDERDAIMKSIEELRPAEDNPLLQNKPAAFWIENFRQIVYTRGEA